MFSKNGPLRQSFFLKHKGEISFTVALCGLLLSSLFLNYSSPELLTFAIILQTGFEAATVGGAADWLAVKMIFDEIKIGRFRIVPASGILPRKQQAIAQGAGRLVAEEWLSPESVKNLLQSVDVSGALADYLQRIKQNGELTGYINWVMDHIASLLEKPGTREKMSVILREQMTEVHWSQWIGQNLSEDKIKKIMDHAVPFFAEKASEVLSTREAFDLMVEKLSEEKGGFLKQLFFDPVETAEKAILKSIQFLRELQDNPYHPVRLKIDEKAVSWISELSHDKESAESIDRFGREVTAEMDYEQLVKTVIGKVIIYLQEQRSQKKGALYRSILEWVDDIIAGLKNNEAWKSTVNEKIISVIGDIINRNHHLIGEMVEKNLKALSPEQIKEQFRSRTYDDMQWIRVNGAVAGFAIGVIIGIVRVILS
jgi:uncharacterized membrane-anchored protein YjiN (DUF445 family)